MFPKKLIEPFVQHQLLSIIVGNRVARLVEDISDFGRGAAEDFLERVGYGGGHHFAGLVGNSPGVLICFENGEGI